MFNHGIEMAHRGDSSIFKRLLAEVIFKSLQAYEDALDVQLLPNLSDVSAGEFTFAQGPSTVSS